MSGVGIDEKQEKWEGLTLNSSAAAACVGSTLSSTMRPQSRMTYNKKVALGIQKTCSEGVKNDQGLQEIERNNE